MKRAILLTGFFTEADMALLMATVRRIEQQRPQMTYTLQFMDPGVADQTIEEQGKLLERTWPEAPNTQPVFRNLERPGDTARTFEDVIQEIQGGKHDRIDPS